WADETLVVDDESTDETVRLAESLGARVLKRRMDVEGRHRNWAHVQAAHEWVLSLDADERVTPELAEEIARLFTDGPRFDVYAIPRRNYIGARWIRYGGWYPSAQIKLFKRSVFRWEETTVHPRAFGPAWGTLRHDLIHLSYRNLQDFADKLDRHTTLEATKWCADSRKMGRGKAAWRSVDRFIRTYVLKQGFREGRVGFFIAWMAGKYQWVSYRKYLAMRREAGARPTSGGPATDADARGTKPATARTGAGS
ncbi:MAG: glycosyltransferase family 2 protein, partial [Candidatus Omnitrophica bacterium]|nr:glycosyltransferase family 2 protein [Candidatus Omnitrophota bacterium]